MGLLRPQPPNTDIYYPWTQVHTKRVLYSNPVPWEYKPTSQCAHRNQLLLKNRFPDIKSQALTMGLGQINYTKQPWLNITLNICLLISQFCQVLNLKRDRRFFLINREDRQLQEIIDNKNKVLN